MGMIKERMNVQEWRELGGIGERNDPNIVYTYE
jgi:hypothetical protein